jgi:Flp pilus assembly protein TadG
MKNENGSVTAEAVIIVPIFMVIIFLIVQIGIFAHAYEVLQASAEVGEQIASISPKNTTAVDATVNGVIKQRGGGDIYLTSINVNSSDYLTVMVSGTCKSILPFFQIKLTATASGDVQRFRAGE